MKVVDSLKMRSVLVEIEGGDTYTRYSSDCWYKAEAIGDVSLEDCAEIEDAYQVYKSQKKRVKKRKAVLLATVHRL